MLEYQAQIADARRRIGLVLDDLDDPVELLSATGRYFHDWDDQS
jgi:hypothetical protein